VAVRGHSQDSRPKLAKRDNRYHMTSCSVYNWGIGQGGRDHCSGIEWALGFYVVRKLHCASPALYILLLVLLLLFSLFVCCLIKPPSFIFFIWFSSPSYQGGGMNEWAATWYSVAGWGKTTTKNKAEVQKCVLYATRCETVVRA